MGGNKHHSRSEWSIFGDDQENNLEKVLEPAPNCCIYRVPQYLRKINEEAYTPKLISIGPLHYGKKELMGMENQKKRYWEKFWERANNAQKILEEFKTYVKHEEQRIRAHYSVSSTLQNSKYEAMILHDAVFIIELFLRKHHNTRDFLLEKPLSIPVTVDLSLLENQVPYFVLNDLYTIAFPEINPSFSYLSYKYFGGIIILFNGSLNILPEQSRVKHFTDFIRCALVWNVQPAVQSISRSIHDLPNATKLKGSGLKFRGIKEKCFLDVSLEEREHGKWFSWYQVNELQIPCIEIYDDTECLLRNLMALEVFHYPTQTHICNYVDMLDLLIDTAKDVDLLVEKEIIVNCVGDNEAIAKMFNRLCSNITLSHSCYYDIAEKMKTHYKYPWNHLKATLKSVYFGNPWKGTATVAAAFLLILTATQTVCSIMQVIQGICKHNGKSS